MRNLLSGIFRYEQGENPYDRGTLVIGVEETENTLKLNIIKADMRYSTYVDVLFGCKETVKINKQRSPHAFRRGVDWFVVYPNRMGCPLCFVREDNVDGRN